MYIENQTGPVRISRYISDVKIQTQQPAISRIYIYILSGSNLPDASWLCRELPPTLIEKN